MFTTPIVAFVLSMNLFVLVKVFSTFEEAPEILTALPFQQSIVTL